MEFRKYAPVINVGYPLTAQAATQMQNGTDAVSPREGAPLTVYPPNVTSDDLTEVLDVVSRTARGEVARNFMTKHWQGQGWDMLYGPITFEEWRILEREGVRGGDARTMADVVRMDNPLDLGKACARYLAALVPSTATHEHDFVGRVSGFNLELAANVHHALEKAFEVKYYYGQARPEEILGCNMTLYPEGCPRHPAYPAGHGAAAGATAYTLWELYGDLTADNDVVAERVYECMRLCYQFAMWRTFAGVHFAQDNIAGLRLGGFPG